MRLSALVALLIGAIMSSCTMVSNEPLETPVIATEVRVAQSASVLPTLRSFSARNELSLTPNRPESDDVGFTATLRGPDFLIIISSPFEKNVFDVSGYCELNCQDATKLRTVFSQLVSEFGPTEAS